MKLVDHYHNDLKFGYVDAKHKISIMKICKCPVRKGSYVSLKKTSEHLVSIGFYDGHANTIEDAEQIVSSRCIRNITYF